MKKNKITYIITTIILFSVLILFDCSCDVEEEIIPNIDEGTPLSLITNYHDIKPYSNYYDDTHNEYLNYSYSVTKSNSYELVRTMFEDGRITTKESNNIYLTYHTNNYFTNTISTNEYTKIIHYSSNDFTENIGIAINSYFIETNENYNVKYRISEYENSSNKIISNYINEESTNYYETNLNTSIIPITSHFSSGATYHANGIINNTTTRQPITIDGNTYQVNKSIKFYENGRVRLSTLQGNSGLINERTYKNYITFYDNGNVQQGQIAIETTITDSDSTTHTIAIGEWLRFDEDGTYNSHGTVRLSVF